MLTPANSAAPFRLPDLPAPADPEAIADQRVVMLLELAHDLLRDNGDHVACCDVIDAALGGSR